MYFMPIMKRLKPSPKLLETLVCQSFPFIKQRFTYSADSAFLFTVSLPNWLKTYKNGEDDGVEIRY